MDVHLELTWSLGKSRELALYNNKWKAQLQALVLKKKPMKMNFLYICIQGLFEIFFLMFPRWFGKGEMYKRKDGDK